MAEGFRKERDPLGELDVPADAYYGVQTARAVENFPISGLRAPDDLIVATILIKKAAAETNAALGRLDRGVADAIRAAADEILGGALRDQFVVDVYQAGAGTSHNMNANEVLANRAGEMLGEPKGTYARVHPNDHVNMGQSTNDVYPTATRLALLLGAAPLAAVGRCAGRQPRAQGDRVRRRPQDRPHAPAGRRADHAGPGVRRLRRVRAPRSGRCGGGGGAAAGAEHRRDRGGHRAERRRRVPPARSSRHLARYTNLPLEPAANLFRVTQSMGDVLAYSGAMRRLAVEVVEDRAATCACSAWARAPASPRSRCRRCSPARRSCPAR